MNYTVDIYSNSEDNKLRFALGIDGKNPLVVIGLNPSTADDKKPDKTIIKVNGIADGAKLDGFIMLNLYPQRSTVPDGMDLELNEEYHKQNLEKIEKVLRGRNNIQVLVAYGNNIFIRPYLKQCMKDIFAVISNFNPKWMKTGELTKAGHPRHPLYVSYTKGLSVFDMDSYIKNI